MSPITREARDRLTAFVYPRLAPPKNQIAPYVIPEDVEWSQAKFYALVEDLIAAVRNEQPADNPF